MKIHQAAETSLIYQMIDLVWYSLVTQQLDTSTFVSMDDPMRMLGMCCHGEIGDYGQGRGARDIQCNWPAWLDRSDTRGAQF